MCQEFRGKNLNDINVDVTVTDVEDSSVDDKSIKIKDVKYKPTENENVQIKKKSLC